jgi:hypothetical protein
MSVAMLALAVSWLGSVAVAGAASSKVTDGTYSGEVGPGYPMSFTVGSSGTTVLDLTVF